VLLHCCTDVLLHCSLLYFCTAEALYCCTYALLHAALLLSTVQHCNWQHVCGLCVWQMVMCWAPDSVMAALPLLTAVVNPNISASSCNYVLLLLQVRMVEARPGIAFIEFDSDLSATTAMSGLQNFKITPDRAMLLSYAKQ
jgi:hypothetical protein